MRQEAGWEVPYNTYCSKRVIERGTRINLYLGNSSSPDFQCMYNNKNADGDIVCFEVGTNSKIILSCTKVRVVLQGNDFANFNGATYFTFYGLGRRKLPQVTHQPVTELKKQLEEFNENIKSFNDDYKSRKKLSKSERRAIKREEARKKNQPKKEKVYLPMFIE